MRVLRQGLRDLMLQHKVEEQRVDRAILERHLGGLVGVGGGGGRSRRRPGGGQRGRRRGGELDGRGDPAVAHEVHHVLAVLGRGQDAGHSGGGGRPQLVAAAGAGEEGPAGGGAGARGGGAGAGGGSVGAAGWGGATCCGGRGGVGRAEGRAGRGEEGDGG